MATCAECVHVEVCKMHYRQKCELTYETEREVRIAMRKAQKAVDIECDYYKDRSRFVELPCKLGDFVYFIKARRVMADIVSRFTVDRCGVMLQRANGYNLGYTDQLGKKIFLTREEAEQALKERGGND